MKKTTFESFVVGVILLFVFSIAAVFASKDAKTTVGKVPEVKEQGFISQSAYYTVEASSKKIWTDTNGPVRTIGFILVLFAGIGLVLFENKDNGAIKTVVLGLGIVIISSVMIFGSHSSKFGSADYTMKLCPDKYEQVKDTLDNLFPNSLHPEAPLNNCK